MTGSFKTSCTLCGSGQCDVLGAPEIPDRIKSVVKEGYQAVRCRDCNFYFVSPIIRLNDNEWSELYSDGYFSEMTRWWANKRARERQYVLSLLEKYSDNKIKNFLEVGCGEGYVLAEAAKRGWKVHGIDVYDNRIDAARREDISFSIGDIFTVRYPDNHFDCIYMDSVLEHVPDPAAYLKELNRIIKKGGILYFAVPNEDGLVYDLKNLLSGQPGKKTATFTPFLHPYHINGFTKKSLVTAVSRMGFKVLKLRNYAGWYEFLKFKAFTPSYMKALLLLPVHLVAIPLQKQIYLDAIVRKT